MSKRTAKSQPEVSAVKLSAVDRHEAGLPTTDEEREAIAALDAAEPKAKKTRKGAKAAKRSAAAARAVRSGLIDEDSLAGDDMSDGEEDEGDDDEAPRKRSKAPSRRKENRAARKTIRQYLEAATLANAIDPEITAEERARWEKRVADLEPRVEAALRFRTKGRPVVLVAAA